MFKSLAPGKQYVTADLVLIFLSHRLLAKSGGHDPGDELQLEECLSRLAVQERGMVERTKAIHLQLKGCLYAADCAGEMRCLEGPSDTGSACLSTDRSECDRGPARCKVGDGGCRQFSREVFQRGAFHLLQDGKHVVQFKVPQWRMT